MSAAGTTSDPTLAKAVQPVSHRQRTAIVHAQFRRYLEVIRWIVVDSMWRFRYRTGLVIGCGLLGVSLQVGALGLALHYAKLIEKEHPYKVLGYKFLPQSSRTLLVGFAALILLGLLSSSALVLISRLQALRLRRRYEEFCCGRAFRLAASRVGWPADVEETRQGDHLFGTIARREARQCGRVFILLITLVVPTVTTIAAVVTLFTQNWLLSLIVAALTAVAGVFLYRTNRRSAMSSRKMEASSPLAGLEMRQIMSWIRATSRKVLPSEGWFGRELFDRGHTRDFFDAYEYRIAAGERTDFISNLLLACAVFAIMITFGLIILQDHTGWSRLIVFLIALRYALVNFSHVNRRLVSVSRLYPHVRRYYRFVRSNTRTVPTHKEISSSRSWPLAGPQSFDLSRGRRVGVAGDLSLSRFSTPDLLKTILAKPGDARAVAHQSAIVSLDIGLLPGHPLWESLGFAAAPSQPISSRLRELGIDLNRAPGLDEMMLSSNVDLDAWESLEDHVLAAMLVLVAIDSQCPWVIIDSRVLASLDGDVTPALLARLSDRVVVITHGLRTADLPKFGVDWLMVFAGSEIRWTGTIESYLDQQSHVRSLLPRLDPSRRRVSSADVDEEDDDDDGGDDL